jgi:hypothetical protein
MRHFTLALCAIVLCTATLASAGVAPNSGADQMSQSGAKIAPKKAAPEPPPQQQQSDEGKGEKK